MARLLTRAAEWAAAAMFAVLFGAFLWQVFTRYILNAPVGWTYEVVVVAFIWIVFFGCAFLVRERDHVTFNIVYLMASPASRRWFDLIGTGFLLVAFLAALPQTIDYVSFMAIEKTPMLRWRFDAVYAVYVLFMLAVIVRSAVLVVRLLRPGWQAIVADRADPAESESVL